MMYSFIFYLFLITPPPGKTREYCREVDMFLENQECIYRRIDSISPFNSLSECEYFRTHLEGGDRMLCAVIDPI